MKFYTRKRRMPAVIIVSLIDILAILLIFVIVTTTFRRDQPEILIKLPDSTTASAGEHATEPESLMVSDDGVVTFKGNKFTLKNIDALKPALLDYLKNTSDAHLALQADTKAPFGTIVRVIDILKEAGVKNLPAFTESPK